MTGRASAMSAVAPYFLVALLVSIAATLACERIARRVGLVTPPRADRWHREPTPLLGGVAIIVATLAPIVLAGAPSRLAPFLLLALVMGAVGLLDDVRSLRPQVKLVAQIVLAGALIQFGWLLRLTDLPVVNVLLTLLWVVGITNAFNLLDNMDGLAAGLATIAAAFRLAFSLMDGDLESARVTAAFLGATAGFLVRNFPPARIFMGDAGSLFIGFFLSGVCLVGETAYSRGIAAVLVLPVLIVLIPIFDTTFVTLTRLLTGRPVSQGGRDHTSHRLVGLGISERRALAVLGGLSLLSGALGLLSYGYGFTYTLALLALLLVALVLLGVHLSRVQTIRPVAGAEDPTVVRLVADFPFKRQVATVAIDLVLIVTAYYSAYLLRFEGAFDAHRTLFLRTVGPVIVLQVLALAVLGNYRGLWRYTGLGDLLRLFRGATRRRRRDRPVPRVHHPVRGAVARGLRAGLARARGAAGGQPRLVPAARRAAPLAARGLPARVDLRRRRRGRAGAPRAPQEHAAAPGAGRLRRRRPVQARDAHPRGAGAREPGGGRAAAGRPSRGRGHRGVGTDPGRADPPARGHLRQPRDPRRARRLADRISRLRPEPPHGVDTVARLNRVDQRGGEPTSIMTGAFEAFEEVGCRA